MDQVSFKKLREKLLSEFLVSRGYKLNKGVYQIQKEKNQLWFIASTNPGVPGHYSFDIGIHLDFVPPFRFTQWPGSQPAEKLCIEGCFLNDRVHTSNGNHVFNFEDGEEETTILLSEVISWAKELLQKASNIIGDGRPLLEIFTPDVIRNDLDNLPYQTKAWEVFEGLHPNTAALALLLCYISKYYDKDMLFKEYLKTLNEAKPFLVNNWEWFQKDINEVRTNAA